VVLAIIVNVLFVPETYKTDLTEEETADAANAQANSGDLLEV